jgi:hypothetical protein
MSLTSSTKDIQKNDNYCRVPIKQIKRNQWMNLLIDVDNFYSGCFMKEEGYRSIESLDISGNCKIRKILSFEETSNDFLKTLVVSNEHEGSLTYGGILNQHH